MIVRAVGRAVAIAAAVLAAVVATASAVAMFREVPVAARLAAAVPLAAAAPARAVHEALRAWVAAVVAEEEVVAVVVVAAAAVVAAADDAGRKRGFLCALGEILCGLCGKTHEAKRNRKDRKPERKVSPRTLFQVFKSRQKMADTGRRNI